MTDHRINSLNVVRAALNPIPRQILTFIIDQHVLRIRSNFEPSSQLSFQLLHGENAARTTELAAACGDQPSRGECNFGNSSNRYSSGELLAESTSL